MSVGSSSGSRHSDRDNGPAVDQPNGQEDSNWNRSEERRERTPSPRHTNHRERSRSPIRGSAVTSDDCGRSSDVVNPGDNLHVSGISLHVEDRDLEELFSRFGKDACSHPELTVSREWEGRRRIARFHFPLYRRGLFWKFISAEA
ncbi:Hypothetical protein MELLADRAFT_59442 [Melampsora larici-populina 98AG31]|uniref:RRM domain-containing protein n=1 Tax=Melampsora larici-populina (strain 98AG31 / pathotype 3-4-7) TaxID=747676 RepID=F4R7H6_MELLP|nr:Hypothetical protein MELLADRAFT_59442 [Melampsora larici-populina 98AG31]EGG11787.1 Hypothetical protein MELLADRAFT_59442 [Melampsora larici-populina 98AG31]